MCRWISFFIEAVRYLIDVSLKEKSRPANVGRISVVAMQMKAPARPSDERVNIAHGGADLARSSGVKVVKRTGERVNRWRSGGDAPSRSLCWGSASKLGR